MSFATDVRGNRREKQRQPKLQGKVLRTFLRMRRIARTFLESGSKCLEGRKQLIESRRNCHVPPVMLWFRPWLHQTLPFNWPKTFLQEELLRSRWLTAQRPGPVGVELAHRQLALCNEPARQACSRSAPSTREAKAQCKSSTVGGHCISEQVKQWLWDLLHSLAETSL